MNQKPKTKNPNRIRFRFSLLSFCLFVTLVGIGIGFWQNYAERIERQWRAVDVLREIPCKVETKPNGLPRFLNYLLPKDRSELVTAVDFCRRECRQESLSALLELPWLERLYMVRTSISDNDLQTIAKIKTLRRLAIWGNDRVSDEGTRCLKSLPDLEVVDVTRCVNVTWRVQFIYRDRPDIEVRSTEFGGHFSISSGEVSKLNALGVFVNGLNIENATDQDVVESLAAFPDVDLFSLTYSEGQLSRIALEALQRRRISKVFIYHRHESKDSDYQILSDVSQIWGPETGKIIISQLKDHMIGFWMKTKTKPATYTEMANTPSVHVSFEPNPALKTKLAQLMGIENVKTLAFGESPIIHSRYSDPYRSEFLPIVFAMPSVEHLEFNDLTRLPVEDIAVWCGLKSLRSLKIHGMWQNENLKIPIDLLDRLGCKQTLERVDFRQSGITFDHLKPLVKYSRLFSIQWDNVDFTQQFTDEVQANMNLSR